MAKSIPQGPKFFWRAVLFGVALIVSVCARSEVMGQPLNLRLRIAWGWGNERQWNGRISVNKGTFSEFRLLGTESDSPGSILLGPDILVRQKSPRRYDGMQLMVRGEHDSRIRIEFLAAGESRSKKLTFRLGSLVENDSESVSQLLELDNTGNRLVVRRIPSDQIRIEFDRSHLVFSPNELWSINVVPYYLTTTSNLPAVCRLQLIDAQTKQKIWTQSQPLVKNVQGHFQSLRGIDLKMPEGEGVYNLNVRIITNNRRFGVPLRGEQQLANRMVQVVVVANNRPQSELGEERDRVLLEFDPAERNWWDGIVKLPQWSLLPGFRHEGPLGDHKAKRWEHHGRKWTRLNPSGWQAYPIPIEDIDAPHELQIEYPGDVAQTTFFSIVEPNAAGKVIPIGFDTGIDHPEETATGITHATTESQRHNIPFWPKTKSPLLLVTNHRDDRPSVIGKIRIVRRSDRRKISPPIPSGRQVFAQWQRPLFHQNFSARQSLDKTSGMSFEDWNTFYLGAKRLTEYARETGFDGLAVSAFADGSTLYPSRILQPIPKYDRGVYFADGRDILQKDVLEMMFRLCDRENLTLVPILEFATPLPRLERMIQPRNVDSQGILLVNEDGQTWTERSNTRRGRAPYYNPLDAEVQKAILHVIREVVHRYRQHKSFGGVQLALTPESYTQLPDSNWGMDARTIGRFLRETRVRTKTNSSLRSLCQQIENEPLATAWLQWRSKQVSRLFGRIRDEVTRTNSNANLYLSATGLAEANALQRALVPQLLPTSDAHQGLIQMGIDIEALGKEPRIVVLRPNRVAPVSNVRQQAVDIQLNQSEELDIIFAQLKNSASEFSHVPQRTRLASFDEVSPFGKDKTFTSLVAHVSPSGNRNRQRFAHSLATRDVLSFFDGGWMLPLGQEKSLRPFFDVFRLLPKVRFENVSIPNRNLTPLTIRKSVYKGRTYFYVVNDSPWRIHADLRFRLPTNTQMTPLGAPSRQPFTSEAQSGGWQLNLRAFDVVGCYFDSPNVKLSNGTTTLPPEVEPQLTKRVDSLISRLRYLQQPIPISLIKNSGFEQIGPMQEPADWKILKAGNLQAAQPGFNSQKGLRIVNENGIATLVSHPFDVSELGQLAISIQAKLGPSYPSANLRIVLIKENQRTILWKSTDSDPNNNVSSDWSELIFSLKQIPVEIQGDVQLGIEVLGPGDIIIDDVLVFDVMLLRPVEMSALLEKFALMKNKLSHGEYAECLRVTQGYWPRYLMENVPESTATPVNMTNKRKTKKPAKISNQIDRLRQRLIKLPKF